MVSQITYGFTKCTIEIISWASIYTLMTSDKGWLLMHNIYQFIAQNILVAIRRTIA